MSDRSAGWQNPPVLSPDTCSHILVHFARMGLRVHPVGHEWVCSCGQVFVVTSDGGQEKFLIEKEKVVDPNPDIS